MSDWRDRIEQFDSRLDWLNARRNGIGASEWASILNVDGAYRSSFEIAADKLGKVEIETEVPEFVEWGNRLEPIVAQEFGRRVEKPVVTYDNAIIRDENYPWLSCSPDGYVGERAKAGYEGKVTNSYRRHDWYDGVPLPYRIQCVVSMYITGLSSWYIACLIGGSELVWKKIEMDESAMDFIDKAFPRIERFWKKIQAGELPSPKGTDRERQIMTSWWPQDNGTEADLPQEHAYLVDKRIAAMKAKKEAEAVIDGVDAMTRMAMGEHAVAKFPGRGKYLFKTNKAGTRSLRFYAEK